MHLSDQLVFGLTNIGHSIASPAPDNIGFAYAFFKNIANAIQNTIPNDPSPCLAGTLGFPSELRARLHPIAEMDELIEERTGAKPGTVGGFFALNPRVDDIPE